MTIEINKDQVAALAALQAFLADDNLDAFILRGGAGTGKTTLVGRLVEDLNRSEERRVGKGGRIGGR